MKLTGNPSAELRGITTTDFGKAGTSGGQSGNAPPRLPVTKTLPLILHHRIQPSCLRESGMGSAPCLVEGTGRLTRSGDAPYPVLYSHASPPGSVQLRSGCCGAQLLEIPHNPASVPAEWLVHEQVLVSICVEGLCDLFDQAKTRSSAICIEPGREGIHNGFHASTNPLCRGRTGGQHLPS
jgi:hypothetical protein